jgi:hypothetical protein
MRSRREYGGNLAFLDILFNTLLLFVGLFAMAIAMMNINRQTKTVDSTAEFIITVTWDKELDCDVDTYVENPEGALVMYRRPEEGLMHLDRDDTGTQSDRIYTKWGIIEYDDNREIVSIRSTIPGEYVVNVHAFSLHRLKKGESVEVTVRLDKINPYSVEMIKKVKLTNTGDEETAFRFTVNKKGEVTDVNSLPKKFTGGAQGPPPDNFTPPDYEPSNSPESSTPDDGLPGPAGPGTNPEDE